MILARPMFPPAPFSDGALNHAHQSAQTSAPPSDTTSLPGRPVEDVTLVNRRSVMSALSAVATLPLAVSPSPSIAATNNSCSWPDLAERFERYHARWCHRRELDEIITEEDREEADDQWDEIIAEQNALARLILDRQPETIADVVLQARAAAATNNELWIDPCSIEGADSRHLAFRRLIDRFCEFAGVQIFPDVAALPASWSNGDAELLTLGAKFDELRDAIVAAEVEYNRFLRPRNARLYALKDDPIAFAAALKDLGPDEMIPGFPEVDKRLKEPDGQIDQLLDSILNIHPMSFAGVAVKLRVLRWVANIEDEESTIKQDLDGRWFNAIDRDVRRLAGEAVPRRSPPNLPAATERTTESDPVFDAIKTQQHATTQLNKYLHVDEKLREDRVAEYLHDKEIAATDAFFRTSPRTPVGREALIQHAVHVIQTECCGNLDDQAFFVTCGQLVALLKNLSLVAAVATA
jgi:hypothetical protein